MIGATTTRARFVGRLAGLTQLLFAALIGGVSALASGPSPDVVPRWVVVGLVFALPGLIGLMGTEAGRPGLLLAAAASTGVGAFVAFSGVTLIFLVPAVLFAYGAVRLASGTSPVTARGWAPSLLGAVFAVAIVGLVVGAGASALLTTDAACWTEYRTPTGTRIEVGPFSSGEIQVPDGATSTSCSTGVISIRGVGLAGLLAGAALGIAAFATGRRRERPFVESGGGSTVS